MKTKFILSFIALAAVVGVAGCTATPTIPEPSNTSTPTVREEDEKVTVEDLENLTEAEQAAKAFPDVEEENSETKMQAQLALYTADKYIAEIYSDPTLANGSWANSGFDLSVLSTTYGRYWSTNYEYSLEDLTTAIQNNDVEARKDLITSFFFFEPEGQNLSPSSDCTDSSLNSCLVNDRLDYLSDWTYTLSDNGSIFTSISFIAQVKLDKNETKGVLPVRYDLEIQMTPNAEVDEEVGNPAYVVDAIGGSWNFEGWTEQQDTP